MKVLPHFAQQMVRCQCHDWDVRRLLISDKLGLKSPSSNIPESRTLFGSMLELSFEVAVLQSTEIAIYFSIVDWHHSQVETWLLEAKEKLQFLPFRSFLT